MHDSCYNDTEFKKPLKDLRGRFTGKWVEVLVLDKEVKGQYDDEWDNARVVAKFLSAYTESARQFAEDLANMKVVYVGGVLIR